MAAASYTSQACNSLRSCVDCRPRLLRSQAARRSMSCSCSTSGAQQQQQQQLVQLQLQQQQQQQQQQQGKEQKVMVKVCGITNAADAQYAVQQGADLIGMIMWPKAKRAVSDETAAAIAAAAKAGGVAAVGVFVDEDAATITQRCRQAGIPIAQLHGDPSRACLNSIPEDLQVVFVLNADDSGHIQTPVPGTPGGPALQRSIDWVLVDGMTGGSGKTFDWRSLQVPTSLPKRGWLLAGGLKPDNVVEAVSIAQPTAVDVSSGVCGPDGLLKDHEKVKAFINGAKHA